ncbi:endoglucanase [Methanobrevibacter sp.]|uniref:endoglucanase n=1 Tax=Methanobrevibacter sp. TaxID=66852 RepID=UPI00260617D9|nr:endoglucanase [uncultured Methanobrevibacter sp.]
MKNSNIIISVIIVLCIAAGVTAYSVTNPDNSIFSLPGYTPDSSSSDSGSNGVGDVNGTNSGGSSSSSSDSSSGSSNNGGSSSGGNSQSYGGMTASEAKQIAQNAIEEPGAYAGNAQWDSSIQMWVVKVYDQDGNVVDGIGVDTNGHTNRV